jgi:hypothetical protein
VSGFTGAWPYRVFAEFWARSDWRRADCRSLEITPIDGNLRFPAIRDAAENISAGESLAMPLEACASFPPTWWK